MADNLQVNTSLSRIADGYKKKYSLGNITGDVKTLYAKYVKKRQDAIIDAFTITVTLSSVLESGHININDLTPQMKEALELAYPNIPIESLCDYSQEALHGIANGWQGKLFEVIVRDDLNAGDCVGDYHLLTGQTAVLADSATQPGWDLQILNSDGSIADEIQLKATDSISYINEAIENYPDYHIIATQEAGDAISSSMVSNSGISNDNLRETILSALKNNRDLTEHNDMTDFIAPVVPFALILMTEAFAVSRGTKTKVQAMKDTFDRSVKSAASMAAGGVVYMLDGGLLSIPASFAARIGIDRYKMSGRVDEMLDDRAKILIEYKPLLLNKNG